jgi:2,3-bisphosphoglycerate-independent phosphoglycerate mutase
MGAGISMNPGDIAFKVSSFNVLLSVHKSNFATMDFQNGIVLRRRADRNFEDIGPTLCRDLSGMYAFARLL